MLALWLGSGAHPVLKNKNALYKIKKVKCEYEIDLFKILKMVMSIKHSIPYNVLWKNILLVNCLKWCQTKTVEILFIHVNGLAGSQKKHCWI